MAPISESSEFADVMARRRLLTEAAVFESPPPNPIGSDISTTRKAPVLEGGDPLTKVRSNHQSLASFIVNVAHPESLANRPAVGWACRNNSKFAANETLAKDANSQSQGENLVVQQPAKSVKAATLQLQTNLAEIALKRSGHPCSSLLVPVFPVAGYEELPPLTSSQSSLLMARAAGGDFSSEILPKKRCRETHVDNSIYIDGSPCRKRSRLDSGLSGTLGIIASTIGFSSIIKVPRWLGCDRRSTKNASPKSDVVFQPHRRNN